MFNVGQRITLLTSTSKKKGATPRRGSVGYVSDVDHISIVNGAEVYVCRVNIIFTRYGFEVGKPRAEKRSTTALFPIYKGASKDTVEKANTFVKSLEEEKYSNNIQSIVEAETGLNNTSAIIVPTIEKANLVGCSEEEYSGWLNSFLFSEHFRHQMRELTNTQLVDKFKDVLDMDMIRTLTNMAYDKETKTKMLPGIVGNENNRMRAMTALRSVLSTSMTKDKNKALKHLDESIKAGVFGGGSKFQSERVACSLLDYLYKDDMWPRAVNLFKKNKIGSSNSGFKNLSDEFDIIRGELRALSRSLRSL